MALYAFDGTWQANEDEVDLGDTNVARFAGAYDAKTCYYQGVGTKGGKVLQAIAGATGLGGLLRVAEAEGDLKDQLANGDQTIDILGFSRGAALALDFANEIAEKDLGLRIRFLGLFDTVHSFGIAGVDVNLLHDPELPSIVDHCFHALALDERRGTFRPTRTPGGYEIWFRGVHSDIGGGNSNTGLNDIALGWMLAKARAVGLPINPGAIDSLSPDSTAAIKPAKLDPKKDSHRELKGTDRIHHTVAARTGGEHNNPTDAMARESETDERERTARG